MAVHWFSEWGSAIDAALHELPELHHCPDTLLREIFNACTTEKRIALIEQRGVPIAVVPLKFDQHQWRPVTSWNLPRTLFPVSQHLLVPALSALRIPVAIEWWREQESPPEHYAIRSLESEKTRRIAITSEDEAYWRDSGIAVDIRRARRRCAHIRVEINAPGAAEWTINNWGRKWAKNANGPLPLTHELIAVSRYWEPRGRHVTVTLLDGDSIVAGATEFVDDGDLVGLCVYRRQDCGSLPIGTRLFDAVHQFGLSAGMKGHDFGSGFKYMEKWAPQCGSVSRFVVDRPRLFSRRLLRSLISRFTL